MKISKEKGSLKIHIKKHLTHFAGFLDKITREKTLLPTFLQQSECSDKIYAVYSKYLAWESVKKGYYTLL
jgi:hypothetical protein